MNISVYRHVYRHFILAKDETRIMAKSKEIKELQIGAGEFKQKCLALINQIAISKIQIVITKRGKPCVRLIAYESDEGTSDVIGCMKGSVIYHDDIMAPIDEKWEANEK